MFPLQWSFYTHVLKRGKLFSVKKFICIYKMLLLNVYYIALFIYNNFYNANVNINGLNIYFKML
jgi:hypothetical protein